MIVKTEHMKKALEGLALQWKHCVGDLARQGIDVNVREITYKYCCNDNMVQNMRNYYNTLKWGKR